MAVLLFLCLKAAKVIDAPYDWYWVTLLLSIELPAWCRLAIGLSRR